MKPFIYNIPVKVYFGEGQLSNLGRELSKYGKKVGAARSLISKYLYFVSGHNFPIEDSLVKLNINDVLKYFYEKAIIINDNLLHELISFCENEKIKFDEFDNFMWLLGKLLRGSLSLLLPKDNYLNIIKNLKISSTKSKEVDKETRKKVREQWEK